MVGHGRRTARSRVMLSRGFGFIWVFFEFRVFLTEPTAFAFYLARRVFLRLVLRLVFRSYGSHAHPVQRQPASEVFFLRFKVNI